MRPAGPTTHALGDLAELVSALQDLLLEIRLHKEAAVAGDTPGEPGAGAEELQALVDRVAASRRHAGAGNRHHLLTEGFEALQVILPAGACGIGIGIGERSGIALELLELLLAFDRAIDGRNLFKVASYLA